MNKGIIIGIVAFFVFFLLLIFYKFGFLTKTIFTIFLVFVGVILLIFLITYLVAVRRDINKDNVSSEKKSLEYVFKKINEELGAMAGGDVLSWNEGIDCKMSRRYFVDNNGKTHDIVCVQSPMARSGGDNIAYFDTTEDKLVEFISDAHANRMADPWQGFNIINQNSSGGQFGGMNRGMNRGGYPYRRNYNYNPNYNQNQNYQNQSPPDDQFIDDMRGDM